VKWPTSGKTERFEHVRPNQSYRLREGQGKLVAVEHKTFTISADHMKMPMNPSK
jgi:sugar lactone lactonase YvrE